MNMGKTLWIGVVVALLAGCATLEKGGNLQANPIVQGGVSVASKAQCQKFAQNDPENARTTGQYLQTLANATQACVDGIDAGLAAPK